MLEVGLALLDADHPAEAVAALERLNAAHRQLAGLGEWILLAHSRARRRSLAPAAEGYLIGEAVETVAELPNFWQAGDRAEVIGLGSANAPIALRMGRSGRLIDVQPERIRRTSGAFGAAGGPVAATALATPSVRHADDHYAVLRLPADFSTDELKRAYRAASKAGLSRAQRGTAQHGHALTWRYVPLHRARIPTGTAVRRRPFARWARRTPCSPTPRAAARGTRGRTCRRATRASRSRTSSRAFTSPSSRDFDHLATRSNASPPRTPLVGAAAR
jgi:hypothetical protein